MLKDSEFEKVLHSAYPKGSHLVYDSVLKMGWHWVSQKVWLTGMASATV